MVLFIILSLLIYRIAFAILFPKQALLSGDRYMPIATTGPNIPSAPLQGGFHSRARVREGGNTGRPKSVGQASESRSKEKRF